MGIGKSNFDRHYTFLYGNDGTIIGFTSNSIQNAVDIIKVNKLKPAIIEEVNISTVSKKVLKTRSDLITAHNAPYYNMRGEVDISLTAYKLNTIRGICRK